VINFDNNALLSHFQSQAGMAPTRKPVGGKQAPLAPWSPRAKPPEAAQRVKDALSSKPILDVAGAQRKLSAGQEDFAELFALYNALDTLKALARRLDAKGVTTLERAQVERKFRTGMADVTAFVDKIDLDKLRLVRGGVTESTITQAGVRRERPEYKTAVIHRGAATDEVASLMGAVKFSMAVKPSAGATKTIDFDLAEMGTTPRTMANVVDYLNGKLNTAGVTTRFSQELLPPQKNTMKVGDNVLTLPDGPPQARLKITGVSSEIISFSATDTADAVFLGQTVGKDGAQTRQLTKFQTDTVTGAPPPAYHDSQPNWVDGRVFNRAIDGDVLAVRASATHADGSVYMLAEVAGSIAGQTIKGERDVALMKYDAAGNLVFSRNLGAAQQANATALAVAVDGTVAVGGSVRGELMGATSIDGANLDSFVTTFNSEGEELWTQRGGSLLDDEVRALAFGADGTLYASGQSKGAMIGEGAVGGADAWIRGFKTTTTTGLDGVATVKGEVLFTTQYGSAGDDAPAVIAVEGSTLVAAGVENGRAVVRRFDLQATGDPVQGASRDLGELLGGRLAGVSIQAGRVILAGSSGSGGLSAATTLNAHSGGGQDVFVYNIDTALTAGSAKVSYWGGQGADQATAVAMDGGDVYVAGTSNNDIPGLPKIGTKDGFVVRLNADTGAEEWARRFTGQDGEVAPTSIAVGKGQASALDRLGLPTGTIDYTGSQLITANTSARAGDRFYIKIGENGRNLPITIEANDTMKTLAAKVTRVVGFSAIVTIPTQNRYLDDANIGAGMVSVERLKITPRRDKWLEIRAGEGNRDLLEVLGLEEGVVRATRRDSKGKEVVPPGGRTYGLGLPRDLLVNSKEAIVRTAKELDDSMVLIQNIYRDLTIPESRDKKPGITGGAVPAHLRAQIANYGAGLARLGGGY
jgi:hypothetical protein